jgi:transcriptional regulator with XRE-family HTH domain
MKRAKDLHASWMRDAAYQAEYEKLALEYQVARQVIEARKRAGLTQADLAERMGTKQPHIARIEGGETLPSLDTLNRLAAALGQRLEISFRQAASPAEARGDQV